MLLQRILYVSCFVFAVAITSIGHAQTKIELTLTTTGPVGLAPALAAFHDGSYDLFDVGGMASPGLEDLAEVGDLTTVLTEASDAGANAVGFAPGGPFVPGGGTGSTMLTVADTETLLSFASMVLPSNDWFIGNSNALDISSLIGAAPGTSLSFNFSTVYDAGTEEEDFAFGPGNPLVGITTAATPGDGAETSDPIAAVLGPDPFAGFASLEPANFDTTSIDFTGGPVATLSLRVVPEPSTYVLAMFGAVGLAVWCRRR